MPDVLLSGEATDLTDGDLSSSLEWFEGGVPLGQGAQVVVNLPVGPHTVTAQVTDSGGNLGQAVTNFEVADAPPVVNIIQPADGSIVSG